MTQPTPDPIVERAASMGLQSHVLLMVVFALFVSLILAVMAKDDLSDQLRMGGQLLVAFIVAAIVIGWLMYPFPL
jgi:hypothetical protein